MWTKVKSALVSGFIAAFMGVAGYVIGIGDIFLLDGHALANVAVLSALTAVVSLVKSSMTNYEGKFAGAVKIQE